MSETPERGLIDAYHIVAAMADELPRVRWWQLGRKKCHQMEMLVTVLGRIVDEVEKIHDARMAQLPIHSPDKTPNDGDSAT